MEREVKIEMIARYLAGPKPRGEAELVMAHGLVGLIEGMESE